MAETTTPEVKALVRAVFGRDAADTLSYVPGAPVIAAGRTDKELNTYERTLTTVIRQTMGNRAARLHEIAEIMMIPATWVDGKLVENVWVEPEPGRFMSGTFAQCRKWTKAQRDMIKKALPAR